MWLREVDPALSEDVVPQNQVLLHGKQDWCPHQGFLYHTKWQEEVSEILSPRH